MTIKMATKAQAVALKSAPSEEGQFEALVAVFNNIDSYGDVILKGAFADTLTEWGESGIRSRLCGRMTRMTRSRTSAP